MSEHTETPWTYEPNTMFVLGQPDNMPNPVAAPYGRTKEQCQANAAFIVRACNSHEALVEAVNEAREYFLERNLGDTADRLCRKLAAALKAAQP